MKRAKRTIVMLGLALAGCQSPATLPVAVTPDIVPVRILATTATYPLLQEFVMAYTIPETLLVVNSAAANWETIQARLLLEILPESAAPNSSSSLPVLYALTAYLPPETESTRGLWVAPIGWDGIAIIVHPANQVPMLTVDAVRRIMAGEITNWSAVGGADMPTIVISRESGADTRLALDALVMGEDSPSIAAGSVRLALSSASMVEIVAQTPGAIGYVSMGWLGGQAEDYGVRVVPLMADAVSPPVLPDPAAVSAATYPLRTQVMIVGLVPPEPGSALYRWFAWMQSDAGQQIVRRRYGSFFPRVVWDWEK